MKKLLIHNDQFTSDFQNHFELQRKFNITQPDTLNSDFSFDSFCNDKLGLDSGLATFLKSENHIDIIFIPYHLSTNNYLEYAGLKIAMHIRLSDWGYHDIPIAFIGNESIEQVLRINKFGNLLLTAGIYKLSTNELNEESILRICNTVQKNFQPENNNRLTKSNMNDFLEKVEIKPPGHYDSKHSVDNELSLLRWSQYIGLELPKVRDNFDSSLYFKYINKQKPIPLNSDKSKVYDFGEGKVLLIDDQWKNGWNEFYNALFKSSAKKSIDFSCEEIQKGTDKIEIIDNALKKVSSFRPDVVILDLRLHDDDFKRNSPISESTGVQILEKINQKHPGISVIITTASSKAETYEITKNFAHAYIQKTVDRKISKSIDKIYECIQSGIKISQKLKIYHEYLQRIIKCLVKNNEVNKFSEDFIETAKTNVYTTWIILKETYSNDSKGFISFAYLQLFYLLEDLVKEDSIYSIDNDDNHYVFQNEKKYHVAKPKSNRKYTKAIRLNEFGAHEIGRSESNRGNRANYYPLNDKMIPILLFRYGLKSTREVPWKNKSPWPCIEWKKINNERNQIAHGKEINEKHLKSLITFILFILAPVNQCEKKKQDLTDDFDEYSALKKKFNS